jgi:hypothetical protein
MCHFNLFGDYRPYRGLTKADVDSLDVVGVDSLYSFLGCKLNFVLNPPAHDGEHAGTAGCHWFINEYCNKPVTDYKIELSSNRDNRGALVCAMYPKSKPAYPLEQVIIVHDWNSGNLDTILGPAAGGCPLVRSYNRDVDCNGVEARLTHNDVNVGWSS